MLDLVAAADRFQLDLLTHSRIVSAADSDASDRRAAAGIFWVSELRWCSYDEAVVRQWLITRQR